MPTPPEELESRVLPPSIPDDPTAWQHWVGLIAGFVDNPIAHAFLTAGDEAANVRRFTFQVRDRKKTAWAGRWYVLIVLSTAEFGAPGGVQTVAAAAGTTIVYTPAGATVFLVQTSADGKATLDITVAGAGTRYATSAVLGRARSSGSAGVEWLA